MKKSTAGYIRLGVLLFAITNTSLQLFGYNPLPFTTEEVDTAITVVSNTAAALIAWWYNNPVTKQGKEKEGEA